MISSLTCGCSLDFAKAPISWPWPCEASVFRTSTHVRHRVTSHGQKKGLSKLLDLVYVWLFNESTYLFCSPKRETHRSNMRHTVNRLDLLRFDSPASCHVPVPASYPMIERKRRSLAHPCTVSTKTRAAPAGFAKRSAQPAGGPPGETAPWVSRSARGNSSATQYECRRMRFKVATHFIQHPKLGKCRELVYCYLANYALNIAGLEVHDSR